MSLWIKAVVDRIADILGRRGDTDSVDVRRSKALGILAQPAEAQQLLSEHQGDAWDGPAEPTDLYGEPALGQVESELKFDEPAQSNEHQPNEHQSLRIVPAPFDPKRARPRAVVYVHLSAEALTAGVGVARVEEIGPVLRRC